MTLLRTLGAGGQLLLLRKPQLYPLALNAASYWRLCLLSLLISLLYSFLETPRPRYFSLDALQTEAFFVLATPLLCWLAARLYQRQFDAWQLACLLLAASLVMQPVVFGVYLWLFPRWDIPNIWRTLFWFATLAWLGLAVFTALRALAPGRRWWAFAAPALAYPALLGVAALYLTMHDFWAFDYQAWYDQQNNSSQQRSQLPPADVLFSRQAGLLQAKLDALSPQTPGQPDMYFLSLAGHGRQDVFMKEVAYAHQLYAERLGGQGRRLRLINNPATLDQQPLAIQQNLREAINGIAEKMDREEDILFLFLTSHGSAEHELQITLGQLELQQLPVADLADMLEQAGIKWKVVVVSACYSGGFIEPLANATSMIITAAAADKTSFGCGDDSEITYFGRAFFQLALNQTLSFGEAFAQAKSSIVQWEAEEDISASEPQIFVGNDIEQHLQLWRQTLRSHTANKS